MRIVIDSLVWREWWRRYRDRPCNLNGLRRLEGFHDFEKSELLVVLSEVVASGEPVEIGDGQKASLRFTRGGCLKLRCIPRWVTYPRGKFIYRSGVSL